MIEFQPHSNQSPKKGSLLVAEPFMEDPYFKRTVILLCDHNEEGSFGFVLNRYVDVDINDILQEMPHLDSRISVGGPVQNENLFYLHRYGDQLEGCTEILEGIYMGGHFDALKEKIKLGLIDSKEVRFFLGYSGWSENQLQSELESKSWLVVAGEGTDIMDTAKDDLWSDVLREKGAEFSHFANFPKNPSLN